MFGMARMIAVLGVVLQMSSAGVDADTSDYWPTSRASHWIRSNSARSFAPRAAFSNGRMRDTPGEMRAEVRVRIAILRRRAAADAVGQDGLQEIERIARFG